MEYHGTPGDDLIDQRQLNIPDGSPIFGEAGDDTIILSNGLAIGGPGNDTIIASTQWATAAYWGSPKGITVNLEAGTADDGYGTVDRLTGIRNVHGSGFDDKFIGSKADEYFYGGGGNDSFVGGGGSDTVNYYFEKSTAADISYDAARDTFTVVKHFANGDGGTDTLAGIARIVFSGTGSDETSVYRSHFVGDFRTSLAGFKVPVPAGAGLGQFKLGDFNGDGIADFAFVTQIGTGTAPAPTYIFVGDGRGGFTDSTASTFASGLALSVSGGGRTIVADFNNDGASDIFQLNFGNDAPPFPGGENSLYLSATGTHQLLDVSASLPRTLELNHGASAGDVNGDGYIDILLNTLDEGNILLLNDRSGHFGVAPAGTMPRPTVPIWGGQYPETNTFSGIVDVDGDGHPDLILGTWDGSPGAHESKILLNDGSGDFSKREPVVLPSSGIDKEIIVDVKAIDLNGDGFADLMLSVTNGGANDVFYRTGYIQLLVNDGTGHFRDETAARLPQSKGPDAMGWLMSLSSQDFNHDGFADILAESAGAPVKSTVYLNRGDGTFAADWQSAPGERALAADIDGDGMRDLIATDSGGNASTSINSLANGHIYKANFGGDTLVGSGGADLFYARPGADVFDGGAGIDTLAMQGGREAYLARGTDGGFSLSGAAGTVSTSHVERVLFDASALAFDFDGAAGQAYRVYRAAFDRTPDLAGLGFWVNHMDKGATVLEVAAAFIASGEFKQLYGDNPDNHTFITHVYQNVLHRLPDSAGFEYWENYMNSQGGGKAQVLAYFSESTENQAQVIGGIRDGMEFIVYH